MEGREEGRRREAEQCRPVPRLHPLETARAGERTGGGGGRGAGGAGCSLGGSEVRGQLLGCPAPASRAS